MRDLLPCPPCGRQGRPGQGFLAGSNTSEPRGSAPRERDHRGGDHPVPSRTRQLSPPSPRVLQRKAAGGQGVALAEGAFLSAPGEARRGGSPCGPFRAPGPDRVGVLRLRGAKRRASPKDPRRIAWEAVEGPLRSRARSTADGLYHAPAGPQRGCSLAGPSSVLGRSRRRGRRCELCRRPFAPRGPLLGRFCSQHASEVLCGPLAGFLASTGV